MDEVKKPMCRRCMMPHYNFLDCPPRQDVKPAIRWGNADKWGNSLTELRHNGGNTFLTRREGER